MRRPLRDAAVVGLAVVGAAAAGCRVHALDPGPYAFSVGEVTQDECGLASGASPIGTGEMSNVGDIVQLQLDRFGMVLAGAYRSGAERFYLDGTAGNAFAQVRGALCALDMVSLHLDGVTDSSTAFHGTFRLLYHSQYVDACACDTRGSFQAVRQ